jgi:hypothetical protein
MLAIRVAAFVVSAGMAGGAGAYVVAEPTAAHRPALRQPAAVTLADRQLAAVARRAGCWRGGELPIAVAVALAESGGRTGVHGDVRLQGGGWGPSVGLWQIRSLTAQAGTGGQRDQEANTDPAVNARHACQIWQAEGWGPWSTWRHGTYRLYLARARKALR